ncbi:hypothetical protein ECTOBSL9_0587 [Ectothiorhodospira sp. BSL-9]|nr:hypothetical protein ECTOBSL9_0587 [Ectothiorhodospira sp. BSL-9]
MPRPRCQQISVTDTPYYHVVSRCVRRTFLCGQDHATGKSFEHRRQWIEDRIRLPASLFAVDIAAYAVMSNHYHLVVKLEPTQAGRWSDDEVLRRWSCLFKGPMLVQRYLAPPAKAVGTWLGLGAAGAAHRRQGQLPRGVTKRGGGAAASLSSCCLICVHYDLARKIEAGWRFRRCDGLLPE